MEGRDSAGSTDWKPSGRGSAARRVFLAAPRLRRSLARASSGAPPTSRLPSGHLGLPRRPLANLSEHVTRGRGPASGAAQRGSEPSGEVDLRSFRDAWVLMEREGVAIREDSGRPWTRFLCSDLGKHPTN